MKQEFKSLPEVKTLLISMYFLYFLNICLTFINLKLTDFAVPLDSVSQFFVSLSNALDYIQILKQSSLLVSRVSKKEKEKESHIKYKINLKHCKVKYKRQNDCTIDRQTKLLAAKIISFIKTTLYSQWDYCSDNNVCSLTFLWNVYVTLNKERHNASEEG